MSFEQFKKMIKLSGKSIAEIQRTYGFELSVIQRYTQLHLVNTQVQ